MKTTVQALKELYATLGGDLADVALIERIPEMIEALNSIAVAVPAPTAEDEGKVMTVGEDGELGFANALPPVTSADAGKVLAVDEQGAWNPAEASGGGGYLNVRIMTSYYEWGRTPGGVVNVTIDVPYDDIVSALQNGILVIVSDEYRNHSTVLLPAIYQTNVNGYGYLYYISGTTATNTFARYYRVLFSHGIGTNNMSLTYFGSVQLSHTES